MNTNQGALYFGAGIDMNEWRKNITEMRRDILGLTQQTQRETQQMDNSFKNLSIGIGAYFSANMLKGFVNEIINVRGEFQKTEIAFATMLKSKGEAKVLMEQMVDLAAKTPFGLQDVTEGAKRLLAFQVPANEVVDTLRRMGDVAAGLGVPMGQLIHVYGQVKAQGKLMTNDLYQFMNAGIPIISELSKVLGKTEAEIKNMVSQGKIGFTEIQQVIQNMTNEGGLFFNLMEQQSASLSGKVANLEDAFEQMFNKIGKSSEGILAGGIDRITYLVENYEDLAEALAFAIATYGAYKVALMTTTALQRLNAEASLQMALSQGTATTAQAYGAAVTTMAQRATASFNATLMANPYAIIIGLIGAMAYAVYKYSSQLNTASEIQQQLNDKIQEGKNGVDEKRAKIEALTTAIQSENTTNEEKKVLLGKLDTLTEGKLGKLDLEMVKTGQLQNKVKSYISTLYEQAEAMSYVSHLEKLYSQQREKEDDIKRVKSGDKGFFEGLGAWFDKDSKATIGDVFRGTTDGEMLVRKLNNENEEIKKAIKETKKQIEKRNHLINNETNKTNTTVTNTSEVKKTKKNKPQKSNIDKPIKGSLGELESELSAIQKQLKDKTIAANTERVNELLAQEKSLQEKINKIRKDYQIKTWEEELSETERQWKIRYQLAEHYGEEVAKAQFPDLKGESYYDEINKQFSILDAKTKEGMLTEEEVQKWQRLKEILDNLNGEKDPFTNWKDSLSQSIAQVDNFSQKLEILNKAKENLTPQEKSSGYLAEINRQIEEVQKAYQDYYNGLLAGQKTYEEKSLALQKEYDAIKKSNQYKNASETDRNKIDNLFSQKATSLFFEEMQKSEEWAKMFQDMNLVAVNSLERFKDILLSKLKEAKTEAEKIQIGDFIKKIDDNINERKAISFTPIINAYHSYVDAIKKAKEAQEEYNKALENNDVEGAKSKLADLTKAQNEATQKKLELANKMKAFANKGLDFIGDAKGIISDVKGAFDDLRLSLDNGFGDILEKTEEVLGGMQQQLNGVIDIAEGIATKNPVKIVTGAVKAIGGLIKSVTALFNNDRKKERNIKRWAESVKQLENAYKDLEYAMKSALGDSKYDTQRSQIKNLEQQQQLIQRMRQEEIKKKKTDNAKVKEYEEQIKEIERTKEELKKEIIKDVLQTDAKDLASQFGDALVDAFEKGENAAKSLDNVSKSVFKNMMKNALNMQLEKQMQPILDRLLADVGFDSNGSGSFRSLTAQQIEQYKEIFRNTTMQYSQFAQEIAKVTSDVADQDSLKGAVQGMSEETAGVFVGQFNAIRLNTGELLKHSALGLEHMRNALGSLVKIEQNTYNLHYIKKGIDELNAKVKGDGSLRASGL